MRHVKTALTVLGAATVLLLAGNTVAYAATGKALLLGKANYANKQTTLARSTSGPALRLTTKAPGSAPLSTNGRGKVANLNADMLDGLDSAALRTSSRVYTSTIDDAGEAKITLPLSAGSYLVDYAVYAEAESDKPLSIGCYVVEDREGGINDVRVASDAAELNTTFLDHAVSGSGLVTKTADATVRLVCESPDGEFTTGNVPVQIVVTPTSRLSVQNLYASVSATPPT